MERKSYIPDFVCRDIEKAIRKRFKKLKRRELGGWKGGTGEFSLYILCTAKNFNCVLFNTRFTH
jgi:hypothetical protein